MSTNSLIGLMREDNSKKARCIYCHWDGYPEYVGTILTAHYKSISKVEKLLGLGAISSLGEKVAPPEKFKTTHSFKTPAPHTTVAFYRDRDNIGSFCDIEEKQSAEVYNFADRRCLKGSNIEWVYLFNPKTLKWHTYKVKDGGWDFKLTYLEEMFIDYKPLIKQAIENNFMTKPINKK